MASAEAPRELLSHDDRILHPQGAPCPIVSELAWEMQQKNEFTIHYSKFPERVKAQFRLNDPQEVAFFDQDIRTQSYLVRDKEGNFVQTLKAEDFETGFQLILGNISSR